MTRIAIVGTALNIEMMGLMHAAKCLDLDAIHAKLSASAIVHTMMTRSLEMDDMMITKCWTLVKMSNVFSKTIHGLGKMSG